jgi:hypothetical protein
MPQHGNGNGSRKPISREEAMSESKNAAFNTADITALSHLYRGEVYRAMSGESVCVSASRKP